jgi:hypothetical protein
LTEGNSGSASESIALVNPDTGEYIVFNMSSDPPTIQDQPGFPGTTNVGTEDGHPAMEDQWAGTAYRYNESSGSYESRSASVPCFVEGTLITTPKSETAIELLKVGDLVVTMDSGSQAIRWIGIRDLTHRELIETRQHPIEFKTDSIGPGKPVRSLRVSPQHRVLIHGDILAPARGLTDMPKVRVMKGCRSVRYFHILLSKHEIIYAEGVQTESLLPGPTFLSGCKISDRLAIMSIAGPLCEPARSCTTATEARRTVQNQLRPVFV